MAFDVNSGHLFVADFDIVAGLVSPLSIFVVPMSCKITTWLTSGLLPQFRSVANYIATVLKKHVEASHVRQSLKGAEVLLHLSSFVDRKKKQSFRRLSEGNGVETEPRHYPYLHALRGYAIVGVISVHLSQGAHLTKFFGKLAGSGRFGVQLFFVSAITLMMSWKARND